MPDERDLVARVNERDSGLRRLKTLTGVLAVAMTALAGIFAGIAAQTAAGHKLIRVRVQVRAAGATGRRPAARQRRTIPPPPPLPSPGSDSAPAPTAPAQPPTAAPAPAQPVVVSGGS
jgi:hypothetical protein